MNDDDRRMLCLPPPEDQLVIDANCSKGEELDECIERLEEDDQEEAVD